MIREILNIDKKYLDLLEDYQDYNSRVKLCLETRLFFTLNLKKGKNFKKNVEDNISRFIRCEDCNSILSQDFNLLKPNRGLAKNNYLPQEKVSIIYFF